MKAKLILLSLGAVVLTGCSTLHSTVLPQDNGTFKAIASANTEKQAYNFVMADAKTTCKKHGYTDFVSTGQTSKYIGEKKLDAAGEGGFTGIAMKLTDFAVKTQDQENYRVEMSFRCSA
ncbi:hypothetical protein [Dongshaea marina]|uniref:hypothetical protein n=1 Tax=Dongshaea marina TaxID=2047966 RepID=UPI00131EF72A|nr:hypothetical protein [Dongshaea marina]